MTDVGDPTARTGLWNARCLRFLVPVRPREKVLVLGTSPPLAKALAVAGCSVLSAVTVAEREQAGGPPDAAVVTGALPYGDGEVDHVLVPTLREHHAPLVPGDLARVLRPGGGLFLGMSHRLRSRSRPGSYVRRGRRMLERGGFAEVEVYGVLRSLESPRFLVPLDAPPVLAWFLTNAYLPRSTRGALTAQMLGTAARVRAPSLLFPDLGFVARRGPGPC